MRKAHTQSMKQAVRLVALWALCVSVPAAAPIEAQDAVIPRTLEPRESYVAYRTRSPMRIDGSMREAAWSAAPWTRDFIDIRGRNHLPKPQLRTRAKILWDDTYLYIAAELVEPHLWGTITKRDAVIFHDNDFEVFIDPDADTHNYYEIEINTLGTVWDLMLTKPYRDNGSAIDAWNIDGMQQAVHIVGTLNRPSDNDTSWTVELALPWRVLREHAPAQRPPLAGEQWRLNFSRVEWDLDPTGTGYERRRDSAGKLLPEHNWVWSPQGAINMHMPERWGTLQFSNRIAGQGEDSVRADPDEALRDVMRAYYYAQRRFHEANKRYAASFAELTPWLVQDSAARGGRTLPAGATMDATMGATIDATGAGYRISAPAARGGRLHITNDGRLWREP
jgi:hypothetical protein